MRYGDSFQETVSCRPLPPTLLFRGGSEAPGVTRDSSTRDESDNEQSRALLCRTCSIPITTEKQRIEKEGKHFHTFFNPAGIVYEIGCFRSAPGCLTYGPQSTEFAWFTGYKWQVVCCSSCQDHLGWKFDADDEFFGLIIKKLKEN